MLRTKRSTEQNQGCSTLSTRTGQYLQTSLRIRTNAQTRQAGGQKGTPLHRRREQMPAGRDTVSNHCDSDDRLVSRKSYCVVAASSVIDRRLYSDHIR